MKKTRRFATLILLMAITTALVTGCKNITDYIGDGNNGDNSPKTYSVTVATGIENGTVTANKITVPANETVVLTATPNDGYQLTSIRATVGNNAITVSGTGTTRTFTMPSGDVSVNATFTAIDYTINISDSISHGNVTANKTTAHYGDTITLTAEPDAGYQFYEWAATDSAGTALTITDGSFTMPLSSVTVTASFSPINSTISVTNGIATVNGNRAISADAGTTVTVTATPPTGKQFTNWTTTTSGLTFADATASSTTFTMPDCSVDITANCIDINYTISQASSFPHGSVTYNSTATYNSTVTLTISPSSGYMLGGISVTKASGGTISLSGSGNTRTFTMPAENVTVFATFTAQSYNITKAQISNGTLSVNSSASCDSTVTVTANPASGYQLGSITVSNGSSSVPVSGSGNTRTFTMPANNVTVSATFNPINYNVTVSSISHGSVTASKTTNAHIGDTVTLTIAPETGYILNSISATANEGSVSLSGNGSTRQFTMPAGNVTISASFTLEDYRITKTGMSSGTVNFSNPTAYYNETVTLTIVPDNSFILETISVTANGNPLTLNGSGTAKGSTRTFTMPASEVSISATFVRTHLGTKDKPTAVGDIVFNDGTATPYSAGMTLTEQQKEAAIAIIFADNIPNGYVLGMGLKHDKRALCSNQSAAWGRRSDLLPESDGEYSNYQINCLDDYNEANYPAFWWAEHYAGSGNLSSDNNWDWFLPVKNELQDVYRQKALIDAINDLLGSTYADPIRTDFGYWSGTQQSTAGDDLDHHAFILRFADGLWVSNGKDESDYNVIAVRRFHF
ncbi:MAG: hypothetical protein J5747_12760 [Spirochaetaceae bacterium]|nr:hypothetical protein [Spirochaetaceae bacterium]